MGLFAAAFPFVCFAAHDLAFVHAVDQEVRRDLALDLEQGLVESLEQPSSPSLMPFEKVRTRLLEGDDPRALLTLVEAELDAVKAVLRGGKASEDLIGRLDASRENLLRALVSRPRLGLVRECWSLRGLSLHLLEDKSGARRDYQRVLETDPSFRPDPRLFPLEARKEMEKVLLEASDTKWRVLSSDDVSSLGMRLGVGYLVVGHLQHLGPRDVLWKLDVFDVDAGRFVGEAELYFERVPGEIRRAAGEVAGLLRELLPGQELVEDEPEAEDSIEEVPDGLVDQREPAPDSIEADSIHVEKDDGPFAPVIEEPADREGISRGRWILAASVVALAAGGAAVYMGFAADQGPADLQIVFHYR